jgi:uncharacterized protein
VKRLAAPFLAGVLFALGLGIAGMARPEKVIAFLDVTGAWDPSLLFVMGGALLVYLPFVQWRRRTRPALAQELAPRRGPVDAALIGGAAVFGVGWGLSGLCPGPSFVVLAGGQPTIFLFVACMFVGLALGNRWRPD